MKLKRKLFEQLETEKAKAKDTVLMAECAINALQELCDHKWVADQNHGYDDDPPYCRICGTQKQITETRKEIRNR